MSFAEFTHNPTKVEAMQVVKPWTGVQRALPFARKVTQGSGALAYFVLSTPGDLDPPRAYPDDWIVKFPDGALKILSPEQFAIEYGKEDDGDGHTGTD